MKYLFLPVAAILLGACGDGKADVARQTQATADSLAAGVRAQSIDLSGHDLPLTLTLPDLQVLGVPEPSVVWKDETGKLEVRAGDHFGLWITEEPADVARLKADLDRDLLKKNTVVSESPDLLVYRSEFPDDPGLVFVHFYQVVRSAGRTFVVQDIDGARFNQQDVERMSRALASDHPA